jgi:hypothetical protein
MPIKANLPTNIDTTYADDPAKPEIKLHQQYHDTIHKVVDYFTIDAAPTNGQVPMWDGTLGAYLPKGLNASDTMPFVSDAVVLDITTKGADVNGTVAQNDTALQATINTLETLGGGGCVRIPPTTGTQKWVFGNVPIYMKDGVNFAAWGAKISKSTTASFYAMFVSQSRGEVGYGGGVRNVRWQGGVFQGSFVAGSELYFCPFALHHADNMTFEYIEFRELQSNGGHVWDMGGCSNIRIRHCRFYGFNGNDRSEAIQVDSSENGALSYQDSLEVSTNSFDGLPTKNVTVEFCGFYPVTVGSTTFPSVGGAFGSHSLREGSYYENLVYRHNENIDPAQDDTLFFSRGVLHFVTTKGLKVQYNLFKQTTGRVNRCVTVLSAKDNVIVAGHNANTSPAVRTNLTTPMPCFDIELQGNRYEGFRPLEGSTISEPTVYIVGLAGGLIENVKIDDVFKDGYTSATTSGNAAMRCEYVRGLAIPASNKVYRYNYAGYIQNCEDVDYFGTIVDTYNVGAVYPVYFNNNTIFRFEAKIIRPRTPVYMKSSHGSIGGTVFDGQGTGGNGTAYNIAGGTNVRVAATIVRVLATTASQGISIYGDASNIRAKESVITGAFTNKVVNTSTGLNNDITGNL